MNSNTETSTKTQNNGNISNILGKRKYNEVFDNAGYDDERYGQRIDMKYFSNKIGHNVYQSYLPSPSPSPSRCRDAADIVIADFRMVLDEKKLNALGTTCKNIDEMVAWCEKYITLSGK